MNGKEILLKTFSFEKTERPLRWETPGIWGATRKRWIEEGFNIKESGKNFSEYFNMETPTWLPIKGGWTGNPYYPMFDEKLVNDDGINVTHITKDGILKKERKYDRDTSMPQFLQFPVENKQDYESKIKFRMNYEDDKRFPEHWKNFAAVQENRINPLGMFIMGPFGYARNLLGDENLMYMLFDEPELIHQILNDWMIFYKGFIDKVCSKIVPDMVMIWEDISYNMGPLISPVQFETFMSPYLTEVIKKVKSSGIKGVVVDTDGDCSSMIPIYLKCGANGFYPFEVQAGMDIVKLKKEYKDSFVIIGGLNKRALAISKEAIIEELDKKVPYMLEQGGYVPMLDHTVPPDVPYENFVFFMEYIRKFY